MGIFRNILLSIINEETHAPLTSNLSKEVISAIDTFKLIYNEEVAENDSEKLTRDNIVESSILYFLKRNMWIYGKPPKMEKVPQEEPPSAKIVDFRETQRPQVHFTTGKRQAK